MDSGRSKNIIWNYEKFISLRSLQGRGVSFADGKKGYILRVRRIGKSHEHSIENVYQVSGLKYNPHTVTEICDKENKVRFIFKKCIVTSLSTKEVILAAKKQNYMYVEDLSTAQGDDLTFLNNQSESANLWNKRLGH